MNYQLTLDEQPTYLHAKVTGAHSPENLMRFLREAYVACMERGHSALLLEVGLTGPSLDLASIFGVILERSADATKLKKIGYVDTSPERDLERKRFAETVALNRAVPVRLFKDIDSAKKWMSQT